MALSERLAIIISANGAQAMAEFNKVGKSAERSLATTEQRAQRLGAQFTRVGAGAVVFGAVLAAGMFKAAQAAGEQEAANLRLENTMANQPALAGASAQAFYDQASALQLVTRFGDEATVSAQSQLGVFGLTQDQIMELIPLVQDYAAKSGTDLVTAARNVGKATDGTNTTLKRAGVQFNETAYAADNFAGTVQALQGYAGGFAEREGKTLAGQIEILKNRFGELAEGVGAGAADAFGDLADVVGAAGDAFDSLSPSTQSAIGKIATFGAVGLTAAGGVMVLVGQVMKLGPLVSGVIALGPRMVAAFDSAAIAAYNLAGAFTSLAAAEAAAQAVNPVVWIAGLTVATIPATAGMAALADKVGEVTHAFRVQASINPFGEDGPLGGGVELVGKSLTTVASGFDMAAEAAQNTADAVDAADQALQDLMASAFDVDAAERSLRSAFDEAFQAATDGTSSVDDLNAALQGTVESTADLVSAQAEHGASAEEMIATIDLSRSRLMAARDAGLITSEQFREYNRVLGQILPTVNTSFQVPGLDEAINKTGTYRGVVYSVPTGWSSRFIADTGSAVANVQALIDRIHVLNNTVVRPAGTGVAGQIGAINARLNSGESVSVPSLVVQPGASTVTGSRRDGGQSSAPTIIVVSSVDKAMDIAGVHPDHRARVRRRMLAGAR